jgi:hypothetical protein
MTSSNSLDRRQFGRGLAGPNLAGGRVVHGRRLAEPVLS